MCECKSYNLGIGDKPEVLLIHPKDTGLDKDVVCVDARIAGVIKYLWDCGITTLNSCCGHNKENPSLVVHDGCSEFRAEQIRKAISRVDDREWTILSWKLVSV